MHDVDPNQLERVKQVGRQLLSELRIEGEHWLQEIAPAMVRWMAYRQAGDPVADRAIHHLYSQGRAVAHLMQIPAEQAGIDAANIIFAMATRLLV